VSSRFKGEFTCFGQSLWFIGAVAAWHGRLWRWAGSSTFAVNRCSCHMIHHPRSQSRGLELTKVISLFERSLRSRRRHLRLLLFRCTHRLAADFASRQNPTEPVNFSNPIGSQRYGLRLRGAGWQNQRI
jgi:hypothetical protein